MQQQSSSANSFHAASTSRKRHGLLPPRCPDSASLAMTEPEKRPDDMILMQLDGVGGIAVIAYQIVCAGIATGKVGQTGLHPHFHSVGSTTATALQIRCHRRDNRHIRAAMSCRPAPEGWEWWAFSYIKSCRSPASLCHAGLHFQLCNIFFQVRHGSGRKLHPSSVFLVLLPPVYLSSGHAVPHGQRQVLPVASFILSG